MPSDFRKRLNRLFGQPTFLGDRVQDRLKGSGLPQSGGRQQDRWKADVAVETNPTRCITKVYRAGVQQGNPTPWKTGES